MIIYPFDPQCRLDSNKIQNEAITAFPSAATRTVVPVHAPFFAEECIVRKGDKELIEGEHFYFSLEHKVASFATARRVCSGITLIDEGVSLPIAVDYHAQGGAFEATLSQIKSYLDTNPDIWDGAWEKVIFNETYPPVKILFDPETFVSEPALIEACNAIADVVKAKDEKETISYNVFAARIKKLRQTLESITVSEHMVATGNVHRTEPHHINALGKNDLAHDSKRLDGKDLEAFSAYVVSMLGALETTLEKKIKQGDVAVFNEKLLLSGGYLDLGETASLHMDEDGISHIGDNALSIVADSSASHPGTKVTIQGGSNTLTVESTGNAKDNARLKANDIEVVTKATLRQYVVGALTATGPGFTQTPTATMRFTGTGTLKAPVEATLSIPAATETLQGVVKVVNEGSHGYPCPGYGGTNFYAWHVGNDKYKVLRNGADDLESDVFINDVVADPFKYTPTADRFRPAGLPATAKPTYVAHGTPDCVWLNTTDGPFILLTGGSPDHNTWRCLKITNAGMELGYYGCVFLHAGKLYVVRSMMAPSDSYVNLWEAAVPTGSTITFTARTLSGLNNNNTSQNGTTFKLFDKMFGAVGEKCYVYNGDNYFSGISISHAGDQYDHVQDGNRVRFCHNGFHWMSQSAASWSGWKSMSYVLDLLTGTIVPDGPGDYPLVMTRNGLSVTNPRPPLTCDGGNYTTNGVRAGGRVLAFESYGRLYTPTLFVLNNQGVDNFENARWNQQQYYRHARAAFLGAYAGPVHSGLRGTFPLSGNRLVGICMDGWRVRYKYDPNGSYSPGSIGYGPTNEREQITDGALHSSLARMAWYFDGDTTRQFGTVLNEQYPSNNTMYDNDNPSSPVSIDPAYLATLKQQAIAKYAPTYTTIVDAKLTLGIHRAPGIPLVGMLQIMYTVPGDKDGRKQSEVYVFVITPNVTLGKITYVALGTLLKTWTHITTAMTFSPNDHIYNTNLGVFKLNDGGYVIVLGGETLTWIGNSGSPSVALVYNAAGVLISNATTTVNAVTGEAWVGTKELGFGITYISDSGEGLYLMSYGRTSAEVKATIDGTRAAVKNILVLSRSDAGDNVAISQFAGEQIRRKIVSLVLPTRTVQGMDLSQDRTITRSMIPNAASVPALSDSQYPVQPKHSQYIALKSLKTHQHPTDDIVYGAATVSAYGVSTLCDFGDAAGAIDIAKMHELSAASSDLQHRAIVLMNMDAALEIDYEV